MLKRLIFICLMGFSTMSYSNTKCFKVDYAVVGESTNNAEIVCSQNRGTAWDQLVKRYRAIGKTITQIRIEEINI